MIKIVISLAFLMMFYECVLGQKKEITYFKDIQPIIQKNCVTCHYTNGIGPFSLETMESVVKRGKFILNAISIKFMPPWKADPKFVHFRNEQILDSNDITKIRKWVESGMPPGKVLKIKNQKGISKQIKKNNYVTYQMGQKYEIPNNNDDDFRFFYIPTSIKKDTFINALQFLPDNKRRVHHSRIMIDTTGNIEGIDGLSETDPLIYQYQRQPLADEFLYGWVPGNFEFQLPKGFAKKLYANSNIVLNMHYSPSSKVDFDQSCVKFQFIERTKVQREVKTLILRENQISNQPFELAPDKIKTFYMSSGPILKDISLLTVQAHAHLLGKKFRVFAITSDGDMIPLLKIDDWDFNWQTTYEFEKLIHIPKGAVIIMEGTYDNTAENPSNPFNPPKLITYGWRTVDEMMNLIFHYVDYKVGDENLKLQY